MLVSSGRDRTSDEKKASLLDVTRACPDDDSDVSNREVPVRAKLEGMEAETTATMAAVNVVDNLIRKVRIEASSE
jgi:hypothetical protein